MSEHEKTRYSDEELLEFKKIILDKLEKAKADYDLLRSTITHTSSNDIEDTSPTFKVLEEGFLNVFSCRRLEYHGVNVRVFQFVDNPDFLVHGADNNLCFRRFLLNLMNQFKTVYIRHGPYG